MVNSTQRRLSSASKLISILDSRSTSSIFHPRVRFYVKGLALVSTSSTAVSGLLLTLWPRGFSAVLPGLIQAWWMLPLCVSLTSVVAVDGPILVGKVLHSAWLTGLSARFYLLSGPSAASLGLMSLVPGAPTAPGWAGPLMILLLLICAWGYYAGLGDDEESASSANNFHPAFSV